ncbi:hypothetical protein GCM10022207_75560 [Streptomyces lannensis]|uniref:Uncharacterized protein n=1 Tax=Streptomyces lannensis TaxID=766498 RepID=A0ABP7LAS0_9ACTN
MIRQAVAPGDKAGSGAAHPDLVRHAGPGREHLCGNADIKRLRTLEYEDGDMMQAAV